MPGCATECSVWLQVLSNISERLADMHEAGYVHRDLKPANVMWLPRQNRWTVTDFKSVASIGEAAPVSCTLAYAAPDVAAACHRQELCVRCDPAHDAWSLGMLAFELLTGAPAFNLVAEGRAGVRSQTSHVCIQSVMLEDLTRSGWWQSQLAHEPSTQLAQLRPATEQILHPCMAPAVG